MCKTHSEYKKYEHNHVQGQTNQEINVWIGVGVFKDHKNCS